MKASRQTARIVYWISIAIIVVSAITLARQLPLGQTVDAAQDWLGGLGAWGPVVFGLIYVAATILFLPGSVFTMTAGALFGLWKGVITASMGATAGAMSAFLIGRYVARERVARLARSNARFGAIDRAIGEGGWRIVVLLRLSPAIPFNLQNYLYGVTSIRFWPCLIASWVAMLPGAFLYTYLGHLGGVAVAGERERTGWEWGLLAIGLLATLAVTIYITRLARRKLREQAELEDYPTDDSPQKPASPGPATFLRAAAIAVLAAFSAAAAIYVQFHPEMIQNLLFGP